MFTVATSKSYLRKINSHLCTYADRYANHLLVLIAFFLPISDDTVHLIYYLILFLFLFKKDKLHALQKIKNNKVLIAIVLYVGLYYIGIIYAKNPSEAYHYAQKSTFLLSSILIVIFLQAKYIKRILAAYIVGVFVSELFSYSLILGLIEGPFFGSFPLASQLNPSPFMYHIHYGFTLAFTTYLLLELIRTTRSWVSKLISSAFLLSITANLVLNIGRTGYVLYVISILTFVILHTKKQSLKKTLPFVFIAVASIFLFSYHFSPTFKKRVDITASSIIKIKDGNNFHSSIGIRIEKHILAFELFLKKPLLGYGTGMHLDAAYQLAKKENRWYASAIRYQPNLDSEYLDILIQFGLLGLIVYLNIFFQLLRYPQPDKFLKNIQITFVVLFIIFSSEAVGVIHHLLAQTFLFFICITLVQEDKNHQQIPKISLKTLLIYFGLGALLFLRTQVHLGAPIKSFFKSMFQ